ncbi:MAG: VPEID-CTERM sorting domain-containing protein [Rhodobacteraceae bacterium]|nr:VPEID-CTERM sorting domain-containing protein [Paracoccaceae bacterium]
MKKSIAVGVALVTATLIAAPAFANPFLSNVPEIDATAGTAAMASLGAAVALLWERRRRK